MLKSDEQYVLQAKKGDDNACEYILEKYKSMVRSVSRAYFLLGGDREDIVQEGMIGLYRAVCSFSAEESANFSTYANICIRRQICSAIRVAARQKHMPLNDYISLDSSENEESIEAEGLQHLISELMNPEDIVINRERHENVYKAIEGKLSKF